VKERERERERESKKLFFWEMTKKVIILIFYSKLETCHPSIGKMHCFNN